MQEKKEQHPSVQKSMSTQKLQAWLKALIEDPLTL